MELTNYTRIGALHNSIALDWAFIILNDPRVGVEIAIRQTMQCIMCHPTSSKASNMNNNIKLTKARKYIVVYNLSHDITRMEKNANNEHVSTLHQYEDQISLKWYGSLQVRKKETCSSSPYYLSFLFETLQMHPFGSTTFHYRFGRAFSQGLHVLVIDRKFMIENIVYEIVQPYPISFNFIAWNNLCKAHSIQLWICMLYFCWNLLATTIASFDLWMSRARFDTFDTFALALALVINFIGDDWKLYHVRMGCLRFRTPLVYILLSMFKVFQLITNLPQILAYVKEWGQQFEHTCNCSC